MHGFIVESSGFAGDALDVCMQTCAVCHMLQSSLISHERVCYQRGAVCHVRTAEEAQIEANKELMI